MVEKYTGTERRLLQVLVTSSEYQTVSALSKELKVSKRSVYYSLANVSRKLLASGLVTVRNVHGLGYFLPNESKEVVSRLLNDQAAESKIKLSADLRQMIDLVLMFSSSQRVTVQKLMEVESITKNTVLKDLNILSTELGADGVEISGHTAGHSLAGPELAIRNSVQKRVFNLSESFQFIMKNDLTREMLQVDEFVGLSMVVNDWLHLVETKTQKIFSDDANRQFEFFFPLVLRRILAKRVLQDFDFAKTQSERTRLKSFQEYQLAKDFLIQLNPDLLKNDDEFFYLESLLLSSQIRSMTESKISTPAETELKNVASKMVAEFRNIAGVEFHNENMLNHELYIHLLSCFYRVKYNRQYIDPALDKIQETYPDVFIYTRMSVRPFEVFCEQKLNNYEIALIAMYFGSQLYRVSDNRNNSVLLVCSSGLGTSQLLKTQLTASFPAINIIGPISKREYSELKHISEPLVISTIPLTRIDTDVLVVEPFIDDTQLNKLQKELERLGIISRRHANDQLKSLLDVISDNAKITNQGALIAGIKEILNFSIVPYKSRKRRYQPLLSELLNKKTIQFADSEGFSWQDALRLAAKPLISNNSISQSYVSAILKSVEQNGPYINIGRDVVLAHARPEDGVNSLGMAMLKMTDSVDLVDDQHPFKLVFVLAAIDDNAHLRALSELATLLGDKSTLQKLIEAKNVGEVSALILEGEKQL